MSYFRVLMICIWGALGKMGLTFKLAMGFGSVVFELEAKILPCQHFQKYNTAPHEQALTFFFFRHENRPPLKRCPKSI